MVPEPLLSYKAIIGSLRAVLTRRGRLEAQWVELILVSNDMVSHAGILNPVVG